MRKPRLVARQVWLPEHVVDRLEARAAARGESFSQHVREVLGASVKPRPELAIGDLVYGDES